MTILHNEGCGCKSSDEVLKGGEFLLKYINLEKVTALNEKVNGSCRKIFKSYDNKLSLDCCESDVDHELIINIPFTSPCKIVSLFLIGGEEGSYPKKMKIFSNREDIDFENINDFKCIQELELSEDFHGSVEYPLKVTSLFNVNYLTLYFFENYGAESTKILYIGLKGVGTNYTRKPVETVYEASPNLADHKIEGNINSTHFSFDAF
ncbi:thioredoxin, putative [Plasmodium relictum]|uniref:Thioredoxin, putative n=1 Tax=Plasmodium relictum TaxID=85471 RepID=A0A1J1HA03_PLARL|nr:thioredoxin, putative [Plasmodium relictum]CRH01773.1 thioredoxin, putative [Plasmodium relictum]